MIDWSRHNRQGDWTKINACVVGLGVAKSENSIEKTPAMMISLTDRPPDYWCWLNSR